MRSGKLIFPNVRSKRYTGKNQVLSSSVDCKCKQSYSRLTLEYFKYESMIACSENNIKKLQAIQNTAVRSILNNKTLKSNLTYIKSKK
ncbi:hypothetical protein BpHYR1_036623 [Brachionus plicatilis]|uniref:Uncharacterized protein n=1 Tax=Brachionus plicatilis TaxID=10195 RepID=A0A3M7RT06_BRAPC|nr:hypothetical protein BpHYR1_036623 [Brachionus plicatilis]